LPGWSHDGPSSQLVQRHHVAALDQRPEVDERVGDFEEVPSSTRTRTRSTNARVEREVDAHVRPHLLELFGCEVEEFIPFAAAEELEIDRRAVVGREGRAAPREQ
jgi:hypothetical protein